jgi:hypothetical protein
MACCVATLIVTYLVDQKSTPNTGKSTLIDFHYAQNQTYPNRVACLLFLMGTGTSRHRKSATRRASKC